MDLQGKTIYMIPAEDLAQFKSSQQEILRQLLKLNSNNGNGLSVEYITAKEFMKAVSIGRTKFDQLVNTSKIKVVKKRRKIYVPIREIDRYFKDPSVR
jgi:hypothetical protein